MASIINADANGVVRGKFTIPVGIPAGNKLVEAVGAGGSFGTANFSGQGTLQRQTWQQQTTITETRWWSPPPPPPVIWTGPDRLAQTFTVQGSMQLTGVDLWFFERPTTETRVQIRETTVGFPNEVVLTEAVLQPSQINIGGNHTRAVFPFPILLRGNMEYAVTVLCNDDVGSLHMAELGKYDVNAQRWITAQPYTVGVLLSSSNAVTWTAHQDRDMTFRLLSADFNQTARTVSLGTVAVQDATDLLLMAFADRPSSRAFVTYTLVLPDNSRVRVDDGQVVRLPVPITGNVGIEANLFGEAAFSPVFHPCTQLVVGKTAQSADYVSRAVPAGNNVTVKVILDARVPSGSSLNASLRGIDSTDTWQPITLASTRPVDDGFVEHIFTMTGVTEEAVRVKLDLTGNTASRPEVANLRIIVM